MIQGTPEWFEFRRNHITSTDATTIWRGDEAALYALWEEKKGFQKPEFTTPAMERGKLLEPAARAWFCRNFGVEVFAKVLEDSEHPFLSGSFDGLSFDNVILLEIKCPTTRTILDLAQKGQFYFDHWCQCQHLMKVCKSNIAYYQIYFDEDESYIFEIERDEIWLVQYMIKAANFWRYVENNVPPLTMMDDPAFETLEEKTLRLLEKEKILKDQLKEVEEEKEELFESLRKLSKDKSVLGNKMIFRKCRRAGNVDYKAIPELWGIDLEKYRKDEIIYWKAERR